jgi:hypothetical protein
MLFVWVVVGYVLSSYHENETADLKHLVAIENFLH